MCNVSYRQASHCVQKWGGSWGANSMYFLPSFWERGVRTYGMSSDSVFHFSVWTGMSITGPTCTLGTGSLLLWFPRFTDEEESCQDGWYPEPYPHPTLLDYLDAEIWDFWTHDSQVRFSELMPSWDKIFGDLGMKRILRLGWMWVFEGQRARLSWAESRTSKCPHPNSGTYGYFVLHG